MKRIYYHKIASGIKSKIRLAVSAILTILFLPAYLLVRIIRPLKLVRFGYLYNDRIGHFAGNTEFYLCERDHNLQPKNSLDIFFCRGPVCNGQLLKMFRRILRIHPIALYFSRLNKMIPGGKRHTIITVPDHADMFGIIEKSNIHVSFTSEEEIEGLSRLMDMGVDRGAPFICLFARDSAYLKKQYPFMDWTYHNYRDCNIQDYLMAAEELAKRGYYVLRMGAVVKEPIASGNPKVIDYACNGYRTELLDIYLSANCEFFVSGGSAGIDSVPGLFRRPVLYIDYDLLDRVNTWHSKSITTFKRLWLKGEHRFLTFKEILNSEVGSAIRTEFYEKQGIEHVASSSDEILDVVIEMEERLKGTWETTEDDEELQTRFWAVFKQKYPNRIFNSRIGTRFLRENIELLP